MNICEIIPQPVLKLCIPPGRRVFVLGDIHGAYDLVDEALDLVEFNKSKDLLISVGDLIDRGENSDKVLDLLSQPFFLAVRGNHEHLFLLAHAQEFVDMNLLGRLVRDYGAWWWLLIDEEQQVKILNSLNPLPISIEISTPQMTLGIVHAELPKSITYWQTFLSLLEKRDQRTIQSALEGRSRLTSQNATTISGIDYIFSGHTIVPAITALGNSVFLDTGAVFSGRGAHHLSILNVASAFTDTYASPTIRTDRIRVYGNPATEI
ncbi:metallophosphoesterase [Pseudomonas sp. QL9]|uniref:metallophosphoesterase n=1 Tax=Pseudomonas sp. QL9 TaxID=3242725 RepID=UPI00352B6C87